MTYRHLFISIGLIIFNTLAWCQSIEIKLQALIDSVFMADPTSIGIMVHVESPEKDLSWSGASGYADAEHMTALEPDQPALIASSIKPYVSATILRLQELGELSIEDPIDSRLTDATVSLFESDGYEMDEIRIKHLLSHTSGIQGYDSYAFLDSVSTQPQFRWTRDALLNQAVLMGDPQGEAEDLFAYSDANYLLCTEIIEGVTQKPFYSSMRELLKYAELDLTDTWFPTLEEKSPDTKPLIHQYWGEMGWDSHNIDISWDLYGGGGIATTSEEIAQFYYHLFNREIVESPEVLDLIYTKFNTRDGKNINYYLGVAEGNINGYKSFGHGGFWGTTCMFIPELNTSIAVFISERDRRDLRDAVAGKIIEIVSK